MYPEYGDESKLICRKWKRRIENAAVFRQEMSRGD